MTVWVDNWQMQCCGEPFSIGSQVSWTLREADTDWITPILGAAEVRIDAAEEHHGGLPEDTPETTGTVVGITAVHCRYAPAPGADTRTLYPVPSSGVRTAVRTADGWTPDQDDLKFVGYLVLLSV